MKPDSTEEHTSLKQRALKLIEELAQGQRSSAQRDRLACDLARFQVRHVPAYAKIWAHRRGPRELSDGGPLVEAADELVALPTELFRHERIAVHASQADRFVFKSSGTTAEARSMHALRATDAYDAAAHAAARYALFPDTERMRLTVLGPRFEDQPDSSLAYMLGRFEAWFATSKTVHAWTSNGIEIARLVQAIEQAANDGEPLALLGTSFAFVRALDALGDRCFTLPPGSRVMQTGGYKGRSRELEPEQLRAALSRALGVPPRHIIAEYGMTELSSQMYETNLRQALGFAVPERPLERALWVPGWMSARAVDPDTLRVLPAGQAGLLRFVDTASIDSAVVIQTGDMGRCWGPHLELLGRGAGQPARGCSLSTEEALAGGTTEEALAGGLIEH